jgi:hypothetical protein
MSVQLLKVSGQVTQPIRNRVSSKIGAVQSASSCLGERPRGAGIVFLTYSQSKARNIDVGDIIKEELTPQHMQTPCSPDSSRVRSTALTPHASPSLPLIPCRVARMTPWAAGPSQRCPNPDLSPQYPGGVEMSSEDVIFLICLL